MKYSSLGKAQFNKSVASMCALLEAVGADYALAGSFPAKEFYGVDFLDPGDVDVLLGEGGISKIRRGGIWGKDVHLDLPKARVLRTTPTPAISGVTFDLAEKYVLVPGESGVYSPAIGLSETVDTFDIEGQKIRILSLNDLATGYLAFSRERANREKANQDLRAYEALVGLGADENYARQSLWKTGVL